MESKIYFPSSYKQAIQRGTKNSTIRVDKELGKYTAGRIYHACSYADTDWKVRLKILRVTRLKVKELAAAGIPERSVRSLKAKTKLSDMGVVELIRFKRV